MTILPAEATPLLLALAPAFAAATLLPLEVGWYGGGRRWLAHSPRVTGLPGFGDDAGLVPSYGPATGAVFVGPVYGGGGAVCGVAGVEAFGVRRLAG
jgi:hypothetical protein